MSALKVGDRVAVLSAPAGDEWLVTTGEVAIGEVGCVVSVDNGDVPPVRVRFQRDAHTDEWWFNPENLEVVEIPRPTDSQESDADAARRLALSLERIREYHSPRRLDGDGFTSIWCRECRQTYPCPTAEAVDGRW